MCVCVRVCVCVCICESVQTCKYISLVQNKMNSCFCYGMTMYLCSYRMVHCYKAWQYGRQIWTSILLAWRTVWFVSAWFTILTNHYPGWHARPAKRSFTISVWLAFLRCKFNGLFYTCVLSCSTNGLTPAQRAPAHSAETFFKYKILLYVLLYIYNY